MSKSLDLGCGAQPRNLYNADELYGVDVKDIPEANVKRADLVIEAIPFDSDMFEFVTAYDFLEHIPPLVYAPARRNAFIELMNEIYRVLKMDGTFLSFTPAYPHVELFRDPTHVNFITEQTFPLYFDHENRWATAYGFKGSFKIVNQEWRGPHLLTIMQKVPVPGAA
ncbi:MAG: class I SAM-dependent methyltransferase [Gammaproteobacteria bacterium]